MRVHHAPETVLFPNENVVTKCLQHSHKIVLSNDNHGLKTGTAHFEGAVFSDKCIGRVLSDITKLGSTEYDASH